MLGGEHISSGLTFNDGCQRAFDQKPAKIVEVSMFLRKILSLAIVALLLKLFLITAFCLWLFGIKNLQRLPIMGDQDLYISDITMISKDITSVLLPTNYYESNNSLYSRVAGVFAWILQYLFIPVLVPALILNVLSQVVAAYYTTKLYVYAGGKYYNILFIVVCFSPALSAYSFFALRDLFILAFFSMFIYYCFSNQYTKALLITPIFLGLRSLMIPINCVLIGTSISIKHFMVWKRKVLSLIMYSTITLIVVFTLICIIMLTFNKMAIIKRVAHHGLKYYMFSSLGLSRYAEEGDVAERASGESGKTARILMFDGLLIPALAGASLIILLRRGTLLDKQMAIISVLLALGLSIGYLALIGNFPLRKLVPVIPLMYVVVFLAYQRLTERKENPG